MYFDILNSLFEAYDINENNEQVNFFVQIYKKKKKYTTMAYIMFVKCSLTV